MNWLERREFGLELRKAFEIKDISEVNYCEFDIDSNDLRDAIKIAPDTEVKEFTEPGPCLTWFGVSSSIFFRLTSYLVPNNDFATVTLYLPKTLEPGWRLLPEFNFPFEFIPGLTWVKGVADAQVSVFFKDLQGLDNELYRAKDNDDASEFINFLTVNNFSKNPFIDEAQDLRLNWVVEKDGEIVARYTSRIACERYAIQESKKNVSRLKVFAPALGDTDNCIYQNGKRL